MALHLNHSTLDASNWYLVCLDSCDPHQSLCSLFPNESLTLSFQSLIGIPLVTHPNCYGFVSSCNGLICITEIYPPESTRQFDNPIRRINFFPLGLASMNFHFPNVHHRCFGEIKPRVEIYSLGTDSWRTLECEVRAFCIYKPAIFLNGNLHLFVFKLGGHRSIVTFDVAGELFKEMVLPEEIFHVGSVERLAGCVRSSWGGSSEY